MSDNKKANDKKEHADFQDAYRRSSNFDSLNDEAAEKLEVEGDGEVSLSQDKDKEQSEIVKEVLNDLEKEENNRSKS